MINGARVRQHGRGILLAIPFLYGMHVPLVFFDLSFTVYQAICFPLFGIPKVRRKNYFRYTRGRLSYLSHWERFNCDYCAYANGVMGYAREILTRTEQYWCPIRNKLGGAFIEPSHHKDFAPYNDKEALEDQLKKS